MSAGKGDTPRPVDAKAYGENYDAIFRKEKPEPKPEPIADEIFSFNENVEA